jgi:hypothetical protein
VRLTSRRAKIEGEESASYQVGENGEFIMGNSRIDDQAAKTGPVIKEEGKPG